MRAGGKPRAHTEDASDAEGNGVTKKPTFSSKRECSETEHTAKCYHDLENLTHIGKKERKFCNQKTQQP